eukprot:3174464-Pyramimonas_sp.AAC.1
MRFPSPSTALRGPIGGSTGGLSGGCRMRFRSPNTALRGPIGSSTEGPTGGARMRHPHPVQRYVAP